MVINLTFSIEIKHIPDFISWMERSVGSLGSGRRPTLMQVREAGGEDLSGVNPASFALQISLPPVTNREEWETGKLLPFLQSYRQDFGPDAVFFMTVMEKIF